MRMHLASDLLTDNLYIYCDKSYETFAKIKTCSLEIVMIMQH